MIEVINELTQSPFGIVATGMTGLVLLLFLFWFDFFAVGLPLGSLISAVKLNIERPRKGEEKETLEDEPTIETKLHSMTKEEEGTRPPLERESPDYDTHVKGRRAQRSRCAVNC